MTTTNEDTGHYTGHGATELDARAHAALQELLDEVEPWDLDAIAMVPTRSDEEHARNAAVLRLRDLMIHHGWTPPRKTYHRAPWSPLDDEQVDWGQAMADLRALRSTS